MTATQFKMRFQKLKPKVIAYRDNKNFENAKFRSGIVTTTSHVDNLDKTQRNLGENLLKNTDKLYSENLDSKKNH